jgi:hypothetical protein
LVLCPVIDYNLLASLALILFLFTIKYNRLVLLNLIVFFVLGLLLYITNTNITIFKYLISIIALLFLINNKKDIDLSFFNKTTLILLFFIFLESTSLRDLLRSFYRSSNIDLHYDRYSGFFLFPGDLGAFCAISISLHFLNFIINGLNNKNFNNLYYIIINLILLLLSQSRMAFLHILISFMIILIIKPKYLFTLFLLLPIIFLFQDSTNYLLRQDFFYLAQQFFSSDEAYNATNGNKRAQELFEILNSTDGDLGYYEGSLPSLLSRFGFFSIIILLLMIFSFFKFWKKFNYKLASLIVILPIILTSLISAPLERPKLLFFAFAGILFTEQICKVYINSYKIKNIENI